MAGTMATETSNLPDNTLGYFFNGGGLNNQKLALFGLFLKAHRDGPRRVVLPNVILFNQITCNHVQLPIESAFQINPIRCFAARHGIEILNISPRGDHGGWDYFHYGNFYIPCAALLRELEPENFTCDFFRSLVPSLKGSDVLRRVCDIALRQWNIRLVGQMRIENDWAYHTEHRIKSVVSDTEDNAPSFREIVSKIKKTLPDESSKIYVVCDEAALPVPKEEIRRAVKQEFAVELFWKTDLLTADELSSVSILDLSIFDFEMAVAADSFIGLTRSTFSNMVSLEKYARTGIKPDNHYIYNLKGPGLALRKDSGAFSYPELASAADPWDARYKFQLAEIFRECGEQHRALELYNSHAALGGANREEIYLSLYRAAQIKAELGFPAADVVDTYKQATAVLPTRAEAAHGASRHCRFNKMYREGYEIAARLNSPTLRTEGLLNRGSTNGHCSTSTP
jgi:hypothetical protein